MTSFNTWLDTFLEEKGIDPDDHAFEVTTNGFWVYHYNIPMSALVAALKACNAADQRHIQRNLVRVDFYNRDVLEWFKNLAQQLADHRDPDQQQHR